MKIVKKKEKKKNRRVKKQFGNQCKKKEDFFWQEIFINVMKIYHPPKSWLFILLWTIMIITEPFVSEQP